MVGIFSNNQTLDEKQKISVKLYKACETIAAQNDYFRKNNNSLPVRYGQFKWSESTDNLSSEQRIEVCNAIAKFDASNNRCNDRDSGSVEVDGLDYFFHINYFDPSMKCHSGNKSNVDMTSRVLTIYFVGKD